MMEDEMRRSRLSRKNAVKNFFTSSTFHGVKYVVETGRTVVSRVLWCTIILTATGVFGYYAYGRIRYFFQFPKNVNVEVNYLPKVEFPGVTICNQNRIRLSGAADNGWYSLIPDYITTTNEAGNASVISSLNDGISNMSSAEDLAFMSTRVAHQKNDMIQSCFWKGLECIADNFTQIFTDYGVCYKFTPLDVYLDHTGPDHGLSLTLNIEEYDYTHDPGAGVGESRGAGVKVLLHSRDEIPFLSDQGFVLSPGLRSFVAIEKTKIEDLESPWGTCGHRDLTYFSEYTMSHCRMEANLHYMKQICGCRHLFMEVDGDENGIYDGASGDNETVSILDAEYTDLPMPFCNVSQYAICGRKALDNLKKFEYECPTPCKREAFVASLSFASLPVNMNADISGTEWRHMKRKLRRSREIVQRTATKLKSIRSLLETASNRFREVLTKLKNIQLRFGIKMNDVKNKMIELNTDIQTVKFIINGRKFTFKNRLLPAFDAYLHVYISQIYAPLMLLSEQLKQEKVYKQDDTSSSNLTSNLKQQFENLNKSISVTIKISEELFYDQISKAMNNSDSYVVRLVRFLKDTRQITEHFQFKMPSFRKTFQAFYSEFLFGKNRTDDGDHVLTLAQDIHFELSDIRITQFKETQGKIQFQEDKLTSIYKSEVRPIYESELFYPGQSILNIVSRLDSLETRLSKLTNSFLRGKTTFANLISRSRVKESLSEIRNLGILTEASIQSSVTAVKDAKRVADKLIHLFASVVDSDVLERKFTYFLGLKWTDIRRGAHGVSGGVLYYPYDYRGRKVYVEKYGFPQEFRYFNNDKSAAYWKDLIAWVSEEFSVDFKTNVSRIFNATQDLQNRFDDFTASTQIDAAYFKNNFLQMDLFFEELSPRLVAQQVAYSYQSLLGDIGGLMGLLLGASAMTLVEFFDFIFANTCCRKLFIKRPRKGKVTLE